ncbi:MAG: ABC transporter substrate-binding protein, partial [Thermoplasmata archaeon]
MLTWHGKRGASSTALAMAVLVAVSMVLSAYVMDFSQAEGDDERVLRIGFMEKVDSLNPNVGLTDASWTLYGLVYDCLQAVGNDLESTPNLALDWNIAEDYEPYGSAWEFSITPNAQWHDGEPLTADDVAFTINLNAEYFTQMWAYQPYTYYMDYAEKVDADTVRIHFYDRKTVQPMSVAFADSLFIPIMPKHLLQDMTVGDIGFNWIGAFEGYDPPMVGTGPFMATEDI